MPDPQLIVLERQRSDAVGAPEMHQEKGSPQGEKVVVVFVVIGVAKALGD